MLAPSLDRKDVLMNPDTGSEIIVISLDNTDIMAEGLNIADP